MAAVLVLLAGVVALAAALVSALVLGTGLVATIAIWLATGMALSVFGVAVLLIGAARRPGRAPAAGGFQTA